MTALSKAAAGRLADAKLRGGHYAVRYGEVKVLCPKCDGWVHGYYTGRETPTARQKAARSGLVAHLLDPDRCAGHPEAVRS